MIKERALQEPQQQVRRAMAADTHFQLNNRPTGIAWKPIYSWKGKNNED